MAGPSSRQESPPRKKGPEEGPPVRATRKASCAQSLLPAKPRIASSDWNTLSKLRYTPNVALM